MMRFTKNTYCWLLCFLLLFILCNLTAFFSSFFIEKPVIPPIKWKLLGENLPKDEEELAKEEIQEAIFLLEKNSSFRFKESNSMPDIVFSFRFLPKKNLGICVDSRLIIFNLYSDFCLKEEGFGCISLRNIAIHEICHALGLNHSSDAYSIMYPFYKKGIFPIDQETIRKLRDVYQMRQFYNKLYCNNIAFIDSK